MRFRVLLLVAGLILAHLFLHIALGLGRVAPDLFVVALLIGSRSLSVRVGASLGFVLGLLEDGFSMDSFGANAFAMTIIGGAGAKSRDFFVGDSIGFLATFFLLGAWTRDLLAWVVTDLGIRPAFHTHLVIEAPLAAVYATATGLVARYLFGPRPARK